MADEPTTAGSSLIPREKKGKTPKTFAALRHRNYQLFFAGQLISVAGTWMQAIAQGWLVYQITHSELALGVVGFASAIPVLFTSPWAGVIVDRVPRRNLLVATQTASMLLAFILAALSFLGIVREWHIILLAAALGLVNAFDAPGRQAFVVEMVGREDLSNAIALNSMMFNGARVIGPALGGLLLAAFGPAWCFLINGLSFLAVIAGLLAMQVPPHESRRVEASTLQQMVSGFRYTLQHSELMAILLVATVFSIFGTSYSAVLPAFVDQMLHTGATGYGAINAVSGLGAVTAAFILASKTDMSRRGMLLTGVNFFFAAVLFFFAFSHSFAVGIVLAFGLGIGFMLQFALMNTLLQVYVLDEMRGRIMGLYTLVVFGVAPFGNLLLGSLSQAWGLDRAISSSAVAACLLSVIIYIAYPKLFKLQ